MLCRLVVFDGKIHSFNLTKAYKPLFEAPLYPLTNVICGWRLKADGPGDLRFGPFDDVRESDCDPFPSRTATAAAAEGVSG